MKKRTQVALSFGLAYVIVSTGVAIWRHPIAAAIAFAAIFVIYALGGPPIWEAIHSAIALAAIYALVFIVGLACTGRGLAAYLWFFALAIGVNTLQAWMQCAQRGC
jgi:cytochrome c oxidase assembly factor CtaG